MVAGLNIEGLLGQAKDSIVRAGEGNRLPQAALSSEETTTEARIDEVAQDFEAIFLNQAFKNMFQDIEVDGLFGGGYAEEVYREMLLEQYANRVSESGGVGIAQQVKAQLMRLQEVTGG